MAAPISDFASYQNTWLLLKYFLVFVVFSPPGSDSLRSGLKFYPRCFFNARSPKSVGRPA